MQPGRTPPVCKPQLYGVEQSICFWTREEVSLSEGLLKEIMHSFRTKDIDVLIVPKKKSECFFFRLLWTSSWGMRCLSTTVGVAIESPTVGSLDVFAASSSPMFQSIFYIHF